MYYLNVKLVKDIYKVNLIYAIINFLQSPQLWTAFLDPVTSASAILSFLLAPMMDCCRSMSAIREWRSRGLHLSANPLCLLVMWPISPGARWTAISLQCRATIGPCTWWSFSPRSAIGKRFTHLRQTQRRRRLPRWDGVIPRSTCCSPFISRERCACGTAMRQRSHR